MKRTLLGAATVIGVAVLAGTAIAAANSLNFETYRGQALAVGALDADQFVGVAIQSTVQAACIRAWPYVAVSEGNAVVGARGSASAPVCDATQPLTVRITGGGGVKYVGFYIVGRNPKGWDVRAEGAGGAVLDSVHAARPDKTNRWVSVTDPGGGITRVYITPSPGSAPTAEFGLDDVTWGD